MLEYQKKQPELGSTLPDMNRAPTGAEPEYSWLDRLSDAFSGAGYGLTDQLESTAQMVRHPWDTAQAVTMGTAKAINDAVNDPRAAGLAAIKGVKDFANKATSNPFEFGRAVGANVSVNPRKLAAMLESPMIREMTVYHGTPHQFPATEANPLGEFDASKQDVQVDLYPVKNRKDTLNLARLVVDPEKRKQGLGSKAMQEIIDSADAGGKTITLSPSTDFGATSVTRLKNFYKRFGFVENKGRNKDFTISESMYRVPQSLENE